MRRIKLLVLPILLTLFFLFAGCSDKKKTMLFIGDSMMAEDEIGQEFTYTALIERQMPEYKAVVLDRSGWATDSYLKNWDDLKGDFPRKAELVFIQIGIYDLSKHGHNDTTITNSILNMQIIMSRLEKAFPSAEIVLLSSVRVDPTKFGEGDEYAGFNEQTNTYLSRIGDGYTIIAAERRNSYIDLLRQVPIQSTYDGIHLNKNGHSIVANILTRFLREYIKLQQQAEEFRNQ